MSESVYQISDVAKITAGELLLNAPDDTAVRTLLTDSRKIVHAESSLFFAIVGERHDAHKYIQEVYDQGVRNFIVSSVPEDIRSLKANFIIVEDTLRALQLLSAHHRSRFDFPVVAITGSNGKTIVKEWLYQLLRSNENITRSPKSYNSQTGVPLSVWQMRDDHTLAIIEAGISKPGEMLRLAEIIDPSEGIFTNIGSAHDENFTSVEQKVASKLALFHGVDLLVYCKDYSAIQDALAGFKFANPSVRLFTWSKKSKADLQVGRIRKENNETEIQAVHRNNFISISIPFSDDASIENAIHCWAYLIAKGYDQEFIVPRMQLLSPVAMRLEMKTGINHCSVINDTYNSDIGSLTIALDFLGQQKQHSKKTIILSDILQSGRPEEVLYAEVAELLSAKGVGRLIGIGEAISRQAGKFSIAKSFFPDTDHFLRDFISSDFHDEAILLKGARMFGFEKIGKMLQQKAHETVLEINLNALVHNLNYYRSRLKPSTRIMAMVKATSYGSGSHEIANILQFHHVDYLAVAYTDEGVELRKAGITVPIMVMNPEIMSFEIMIRNKLEPEIYNFRLLNQLGDVLKRHAGEPVKVHIKLDTGMHRLGFEKDDISGLAVRLNNNKNIRVQSIFTHLAASDEAEHDGFTKMQMKRFREMSDDICESLTYPVLRHVLNSSGIFRFSEEQLDMVRLGIGLYGIASTAHEQSQLQQVATLRSTISQIRSVPANETIGYSRKGMLKQDSLIATVAIGYADGISRRLGNGAGKMIVNGQFAPIVGNVCMDMCMLNITDIPAREGDEVIVFGPGYSVVDVARDAGTIPYEVLVNVSQRVKRVFYHE